MKKLLIIAVIILTSSFIYSATYQSNANGQWTASIWDLAGYPQLSGDNVDISHNITVASGVSITIHNLVVGNNNTLTINGDLTVYDLTINNSFDLIVTGTLTILHNVTLNNNSLLGVSGTGAVAVAGNFAFSNNADAIIDGTLSVAGTLSGGNQNAITGNGTVSAGNYSGNGSVFGTTLNSLVDGATYQDGGGSAIILPIELTYFNAHTNKTNIAVTWQTATELNNDFFTLERSVNGIDFEILKTIKGAGTSMSAINYSYTDNYPLNGVSYYRLKQTDFDGKSEVFSPVSVSYLNENEIIFGFNPDKKELSISMSGEMGYGIARIYNILGVLVKSSEITENYTTLNVSDIPTGNYILVISANNQYVSKRIMVR